MPRTPNRGTFPAVLAGACLLAAGALAEEPPAAPECAPRAVEVDGAEEPLTRAERIARMDEALDEALRRFDACQTAGDGPGPGGNGAGGVAPDSLAAEGVRGTGTADAADGAKPVESTAAGDVRGEKSDKGEKGEGDGPKLLARRSVNDPPDKAEPPAPALPRTARTPPPAGGRSTDGARHGGGSGDVPDDIPGADNDSALEAQIRRAAMEETDPVLQAELWNEYRRYKGLPERPVPEDAGDARDPG